MIHELLNCTPTVRQLTQRNARRSLSVAWPSAHFHLRYRYGENVAYAGNVICHSQPAWLHAGRPWPTYEMQGINEWNYYLLMKQVM